MNKIVLASQSPRRKELLGTIGVEFSSLAADIDETPKELETPKAYVERLAYEKAAAVLVQYPAQSVWALGSDTSVILDQHILGKPADYAEFKFMMQQLSGRKHQVLTAVALCSADHYLHCVVETSVEFCELTEPMMLAYWQTGEPQDKAGGYGIQGFGSYFVQNISGSYSAVVGLPLRETALLLQQAGFALWHGKLTAN